MMIFVIIYTITLLLFIKSIIFKYIYIYILKTKQGEEKKPCFIFATELNMIKICDIGFDRSCVFTRGMNLVVCVYVSV
jgi:hypothetical protein